MPNISEEKWIEMLEKKADGTYIAKYPKVKSKTGVTFDEHLADYTQFKNSKGQPNGLASLDENGNIHEEQMQRVALTYMFLNLW